MGRCAQQQERRERVWARRPTPGGACGPERRGLTNGFLESGECAFKMIIAMIMIILVIKRIINKKYAELSVLSSEEFPNSLLFF